MHDDSLVPRFVQLSRKVGDAPTLFKRLDRNGNQVLSFVEWRDGLRRMHLGLEDAEIEQLYLSVSSERGITFRDLVVVLQSDKQPMLVQRAFSSLQEHFKRVHKHREWS